MQFKAFNSKDLSTIAVGTGFFWRNDKNVYLVTNKHNLTGRDFVSGNILSKETACIPNILNANFYDNKARQHSFSIKLYDGDNNPDHDTPIWKEHAEGKCDIACIKLFEKEQAFDQGLILMNQFDSEAKVSIGGDVFILGYPKDIHVENTPIWKRGSIASEPDISAYQGQPSFLIDTATKEGMSGAPVILFSKGIRENEDNSTALMTVIDKKFIGIYSGRLGKNNFEAQLGIVWKKEVIEGIFTNHFMTKLPASHHICSN